MPNSRSVLGRRVSRCIGAAGFAAVLAASGIAMTGGPSGAATWSCPNFTDTDIPTPPAGTTGYLFIGTSISTNTSSITVMYTGGQQTVDGVQQGNGAFHYVVYIPQGATVTDATVTGATDTTVVTVSGCLNGAPAPTVTTGGTPSGSQVAGETVTRPATAVVGAARFTG